MYAIMFLLTSVLAWIMLSDWAVKLLEKYSLGYLKPNCENGACYGVIVAHKVMFSLFLLHLGLCIIVRNLTEASAAKIQYG